MKRELLEPHEDLIRDLRSLGYSISLIASHISRRVGQRVWEPDIHRISKGVLIICPPTTRLRGRNRVCIECRAKGPLYKGLCARCK